MLMRRFLMPRFAVTLFYAIRDRAKVSPRAEVEFSPDLRLAPGVTVSSFTKIKASDGWIRVGERSGFATGCFVSTGSGGVEIGRDVLCGPNVAIVGSHYNHEELEVPFEEQGHASHGVRIGHNVWIGANSTVVDGAVLRENTIVVAGSLVNRRYPPNVVIQGSPAKVILRRGKREERE